MDELSQSFVSHSFALKLAWRSQMMHPMSGKKAPFKFARRRVPLIDDAEHWPGCIFVSFLPGFGGPSN
jgi:hypothetical protein